MGEPLRVRAVVIVEGALPDHVFLYRKPSARGTVKARQGGKHVKPRGGEVFCTKCGTEIPDQSQFCSKCGARQSTATPTPTAATPAASPSLAPTETQRTINTNLPGINQQKSQPGNAQMAVCQNCGKAQGYHTILSTGIGRPPGCLGAAKGMYYNPRMAEVRVTKRNLFGRAKTFQFVRWLP